MTTKRLLLVLLVVIAGLTFTVAVAVAVSNILEEDCECPEWPETIVLPDGTVVDVPGLSILEEECR